jgi:hypothetical protein
VDAAAQRRDEYKCQRQVVLHRKAAAETAAAFAECLRTRGYHRLPD